MNATDLRAVLHAYLVINGWTESVPTLGGIEPIIARDQWR